MTTKTYFILAAIFLLLATSCKKEDQHVEIETGDRLLIKATEILKGELVFGQRVKMNNVDKTQLPEGCPTKFIFTWKEKKQRLQIYLEKIKPGAMPFAISMTSDAMFMELNSWEKDEYKGEGWIKFFDDKAVVTGYQEDQAHPVPEPDGSAIVKGYLNVNTEEIEFIVNYNMMNVIGQVYKQKVDKSRTNYEYELYLFEEGLCEYKLDHGHSTLGEDVTRKATDLLKGDKAVQARLTLDGKTAAEDDKLPLRFTWKGTPVTNIKGRMAVSLAKTAVNNKSMQISVEASARWLDMLTWSEEKIYGSSTSRWIKLKAIGVKTTLWSADGSTQIKTSDKGELRMIVDVQTGKTTFILTDKSLKLSMEAPLRKI